MNLGGGEANNVLEYKCSERKLPPMRSRQGEMATKTDRCKRYHEEGSKPQENRTKVFSKINAFRFHELRIVEVYVGMTYRSMLGP